MVAHPSLTGGHPQIQSQACVPTETAQAEFRSACAPTGISESLNDLRDFLAEGVELPEIVGSSPELNRSVSLARKYAGSAAPVLISGESGTGKELIARLIHQLSDRRDRPYLQINCAALSESLIESELFGHEKGAFTGADTVRLGKFESASGGTLLLDEIGEMPEQLQAKLLRVLEQFEFQRVGGNSSIHVDTRIVATTNRTLLKEVQRGFFRLDLFHRLNVLNLRIPPVRERSSDIPELVSAFIRKFQSEAETPILAVSHAAMQNLLHHHWSGNIRELRNAIWHACVVNTTGTIEARDLPETIRESISLQGHSQQVTPEAIQDSDSSLVSRLADLSLEEVERRVIFAALERFDGNKAAAARHLGVTARTISNKMQRYREK